MWKSPGAFFDFGLKRWYSWSVNPWLNYHHLYYFKVIATEGGIAKAAGKLSLGQPTLSAQLKQFEEHLGVRLFERQHRKLILTDAGRTALGYANEIFRTGAEMVEVLHDQLTPTRTHIQLGALDSVPKDLTFRLVQAAYKVGPCSVSVLEGSDDVLLRELLAHRIDLLLTNHLPSVTDGKKVVARSLAKMPVLVCGAEKFKGLKKNFPKSLNQAPFVLPTTHSKLRHELDHYFKVNGIQVDVVAETQDTSLQKIMGSQGIGLVPLGADALVKGDSMVTLGVLEGVREELYLVSGSRKIENPISSALMRTFSLA